VKEIWNWNRERKLGEYNLVIILEGKEGGNETVHPKGPIGVRGGVMNHQITN
jgi:hypothetical protein